MFKLNGWWQAVLGGLVAVVLIYSIPMLIKKTEEAFKDVVRDVKTIHVQLDRLEKVVSGDVRTDLDALRGQVERLLTLKPCSCLDGDKCGCAGNKPSPVKPDEPAASQWYRSRTNFNLLYYGYIGKDGVLYYSYWSINGVIVKTGKQINETTNDFLPEPVPRERTTRS